MSEQFPNIEQIKKHWESAARQSLDAAGLRPTARDPYLQSVIETAMARFLTPGQKLLDLGCGDGLSTLRFARITGQAVGVDYVADFIKAAREHAAAAGIENIHFETGNILDLEPIRQNFGAFDTITTIRCLINLPDWPHQAAALEQVALTLQPGGLYLASEGWLEGLEGLNLYRGQLQLPAIPVVGYNCFISRARFAAEAQKYFEIIDYVNLGLYLFLSRVVQPLFTRPEPPSHTHHLNEVAAEIVNRGIMAAAFDSCDYCGTYILRKRG